MLASDFFRNTLCRVRKWRLKKATMEDTCGLAHPTCDLRREYI